MDLYFILKEKHVELQEIVDIAEKKYGEEFDARLAWATTKRLLGTRAMHPPTNSPPSQKTFNKIRPTHRTTR